MGEPVKFELEGTIYHYDMEKDVYLIIDDTNGDMFEVQSKHVINPPIIKENQEKEEFVTIDIVEKFQSSLKIGEVKLMKEYVKQFPEKCLSFTICADTEKQETTEIMEFSLTETQRFISAYIHYLEQRVKKLSS